MTNSIWSTGARRPVRLVAVAKTPEVSLADPQQLCRLLATQSPRPITLQPFDIPRHPYLGSHPDPPVCKPSKNRTDRLLPNPDISSATDICGEDHWTSRDMTITLPGCCAVKALYPTRHAV